MTAFGCGAIINPDTVISQIEGGTVMALGGALFEAVAFDQGPDPRTSLAGYRVPRFADVPELEVVLLDRPVCPRPGAGETPLIAVAPAVANASTSRPPAERLRSLPLVPLKEEYGHVRADLVPRQISFAPAAALRHEAAASVGRCRVPRLRWPGRVPRQPHAPRQPRPRRPRAAPPSPANGSDVPTRCRWGSSDVPSMPYAAGGERAGLAAEEGNGWYAA